MFNSVAICRSVALVGLFAAVGCSVSVPERERKTDLGMTQLSHRSLLDPMEDIEYIMRAELVDAGTSSVSASALEPVNPPKPIHGVDDRGENRNDDGTQ